MVDSVKELTVDLHDYPEHAKIFRRTAVRGIVARGGRYLFVYSRRFGDCKFPGGGMEQHETHADTLIREVREETGYDVLPESVGACICVHERRRGLYGDLLCMDSYYYFCAVGDAVHPQKLDAYERDEGYEVRWLTLAEASAYNEAALQNDRTTWVQRERAVLQYLAENCDGHRESRPLLPAENGIQS